MGANDGVTRTEYIALAIQKELALRKSEIDEKHMLRSVELTVLLDKRGLVYAVEFSPCERRELT
jgi:hypothetical protein